MSLIVASFFLPAATKTLCSRYLTGIDQSTVVCDGMRRIYLATTFHSSDRKDNMLVLEIFLQLNERLSDPPNSAGHEA
jgi:hypothetical protein